MKCAAGVHLYSADGHRFVWGSKSSPIISACHHFENEWLKIDPTILDLAGCEAAARKKKGKEKGASD